MRASRWLTHCFRPPRPAGRATERRGGGLGGRSRDQPRLPATPAADAPAQSMMIPMADMANHVRLPAESAVLLVARPATLIAWDAKPWLWAAPHTPEDPSRSEPSSSTWCGRQPWPETAILPVPVSPSDAQVHPVHTVKGLSEDGAYFIVLAREPIKKGEQVHAPCGGMPHARHVHATRMAHAMCTAHGAYHVHSPGACMAHAWRVRGQSWHMRAGLRLVG